MQDPAELFTVADDVAEEVVGGAVLVHAVHGFVDAGGAGQLLANHIQSIGDPRRLVTFDADQLIDYRSRRPIMTFDSSQWVDYDDPVLAIDLVTDVAGVPFLLMHGSEPDLQWERWAAAVRQVVETFDVSLTIGVHGIPMGVPHTRPLGFTAHSTRADLVADYRPWFSSVKVPASAAALLELRLGQNGFDAMGFAVHVPHYIASMANVDAALVGLTQVERSAGLDLDSAGLSLDVGRSREAIEEHVQSVDGLPLVITALEEQFDLVTQGAGRVNLLADGTDIPTADEIGALVEQFLAENTDTDRPE